MKQRNPDFLSEVVKWSVSAKLFHVQDDFTEKSTRLYLNYGHTFGQSIESYYGLCQSFLRHGEAVSLGMVSAAFCSNLYYSSDDSHNLLTSTISILDSYNLPTRFTSSLLPNFPPVSKLVDNLINDKKRLSQGNRFILCPAIGSPAVVTLTASDNELLFSSFHTLYP